MHRLRRIDLGHGAGKWGRPRQAGVDNGSSCLVVPACAPAAPASRADSQRPPPFLVLTPSPGAARIVQRVTWGTAIFNPMANIGYGMIQMVRFLYGEADYDALAVIPNHRVKTAFATMYFLLYVAVVLLLLSNLLIAMIVRVYSNGWGSAEKQWRLRWAQYVLRWGCMGRTEEGVWGAAEGVSRAHAGNTGAGRGRAG